MLAISGTVSGTVSMWSKWGELGGGEGGKGWRGRDRKLGDRGLGKSFQSCYSSFYDLKIWGLNYEDKNNFSLLITTLRKYIVTSEI